MAYYQQQQMPWQHPSCQQNGPSSPVPSYLQNDLPAVQPASPYSSTSTVSHDDSTSSFSYDNLEKESPDNNLRIVSHKAANHALALLERSCGQSSAPTGASTPMTYKHATPESAREAAIRHYKKTGTALNLKQDKESMAESTRARKPVTAEDVRDPETVAGMKCKLDWDREKEAKEKALRLLNEGFFY